jgi:hypothetical protein
MSKKHQKAAAAHARANRHKPKTSTPSPETISEPLAETFIDSPRQKTSGQKQSEIECWVIQATQCAQSDGMCETLVIGRNFARRLKRRESFWFRVIQLFNKQIINRKDPQISIMRTFFATKSASELQTSESQTTPQVTSRNHRDFC